MVRCYIWIHSKFYLQAWITFFLTLIVFVKYSELATGWTYEKSLFNPCQVHEISKAPTMALGPTQAPLHWVQGALSPGIKQPKHKADHSSPSHAEANDEWSHTVTPPICLHCKYFLYQESSRNFIKQVSVCTSWYKRIADMKQHARAEKVPLICSQNKMSVYCQYFILLNM